MATTTKASLTTDEVVHLGIQFQNRLVTTPDEFGKYIAVAVDFDDYEIDRNGAQALLRLKARHPHAQFYLGRVGHKSTEFLRAPR